MFLSDDAIANSPPAVAFVQLMAVGCRSTATRSTLAEVIVAELARITHFEE